MSTDGEIDTSGFVRTCEELARISGRDFEDVLMPLLGQLLKACVGGTPARTVADITRRVSKDAGFVEFSDGTIISTWKKANHAEMYFEPSTYPLYADRWPKGTPVPAIVAGKSWHAMNDPNRHWSNARWGRFQQDAARYEAQHQQDVKQRLADTLAARGLAKKTWVQIADALGLDIAAAGYVRGANFKGREFREGFATKLVEQGALIVEMMNANPLGVGKLNGRAILEKAFASRESAFEREWEKGVFSDLETRARRYPGVFLEAA